MNPDALLLSSDVARVCGVSAEAVRQWERQGRLSATRTLNGVRLFVARDVVRLAEEREARQLTTSAGPR